MNTALDLEALRAETAQLATELSVSAPDIDRERRFPDDHFAALARSGLLGLMVPEAYGGRGGNLSALAAVCEPIGAASGSTGLCFLMHCCGSALIASKATALQGDRWLRAAATGAGLATLAFSERGTGAHFYSPELKATQYDGGFIVNGRKSFVTNGGHAAVYPILVNASGEPGLDVLLVSPDLPGVSFDGQWDGIGMTGNSSVAMQLDDVHLPADRLLGHEGDGQDLVFNVVAPHFLVGLAAVNVGIAQAAIDAAVEHVKTRRYATGQSLSEIPNTQRSLAEMNIATEAARRLTIAAAAAGDSGDPAALILIIESKIAATEAAMHVTEMAMQVTGGQGYTRRLPVERFWRDSHAGSVMAPTNDVLKEWVGKLMAGLPLF